MLARHVTQKVSAYLKSLELNLRQKSQRLNEYEIYSILEFAEINVCKHLFLYQESTKQERTDWASGALKLGATNGKLVLKITGRDILHKSDVGGVKIIDIADLKKPTEALKIADKMMKSIDGAEGVLATEFIPYSSNEPGQEILLSIKQDPAFGPVVVFGVGGLLTEWYGKATGKQSRIIFPALNLDYSSVKNTLISHPLFSIYFKESRINKEKPVEIDKIIDLILKFGIIAAEYSPASAENFCLEEIEINPIVINAKSLIAIDGVGLVSKRRWKPVKKQQDRISKMMNPSSVAVLGVSANSMNPGRVIANNLKNAACIEDGKIYIVHPKEIKIDDLRCFPSVSTLPGKVDLAVVCVPAAVSGETISDLIEFDKAESIILIPGGFAEAGHPELSEEIENMLKQSHSRRGGGPVMVGGNCLGIVSKDKYNTFFLPSEKLPFSPAPAGDNLAVISQSGAYLVAFASNYDGIINPSASISFGNQMDLTVSDLLDFYIDDDNVNVIACYVEGYKDGDGFKFFNSLLRAKENGKQVIVYKAGRTELGAKAAASHTASLAGDFDLAEACIKAAHGQIAYSLNDFEDLIKTYTMLASKKVAGRKVGIISNAGFECSVVTDNLNGLELVDFDEQVMEKLNEVLPSYAHKQNPVDATPIADTKAYSASVRAVINSDNIDCAIISSVPVTPALNNLLAEDAGRLKEDLYAEGSQGREFVDIIAASDKPAVVVVDSGKLYDPLANMVQASGIPVFRKIDSASKALSSFINNKFNK